MPDIMQGNLDRQIVILYLINAVAIIIVTTIHEFTKALISYKLGDEIPKKEKRITLNPIKHFEPVGFLLMLFLGYGWGKPVRTSSLYYKDRKKGTIITYTLPIIVNFILGAVLYFFARVITLIDTSGYGMLILLETAIASIKLAIFNFIPVYPLCASKILSILLDSNKSIVYNQYEKIFQLVMIILLIFPILRSALDYVVSFILSGLDAVTFFIV